MSHQTAKLFLHGEQQAVQLPAEYRFEGGEVFIRRDPRNGDVILSARPDLSWVGYIALRHRLGVLPREMLGERVQGTQQRDPFDTWSE